MRSRLHRFLSGCVVALLMGNAFAIGMILADDDVETSTESPARTLTLITTADGRRMLVDPNTDAGRQAIADAQRNGSTITQVTMPATSSTVAAAQDGSTTLPTLPPIDGILPIDPGSTIDKTVDTLLDTVTTVSSIINDTQSTIANVSTTVDEVVTTVSSTVSTVVTTVSTTVGGVVQTVTAPVTSVLNELGSTGSDPATTTVDSQPICTLLAC